MALDSEQARLFVACRLPARLLQLDLRKGSVTARIATAGDADDLFYDRLRHRLYVIGGAGFVDVVDAPIRVPSPPLRINPRRQALEPDFSFPSGIGSSWPLLAVMARRPGC